VEVVFVRHNDGPGKGLTPGNDAFEIFEEFSPKPNEKVFDKRVNSAFHPSVGLHQYLQDKGENEIMIVGLQTDFCIDATIKSGFDKGYKVFVPKYTNSTFENAYMDKEKCYGFYNEFMWPKRYYSCPSIEQALSLIADID